MAFVCIGDQATCLQLQDTSPRSPTGFLRAKKKDEQTESMLGDAAISKCVGISRTPDIGATAKDSMCTGEVFRDSPRS